MCWIHAGFRRSAYTSLSLFLVRCVKRWGTISQFQILLVDTCTALLLAIESIVWLYVCDDGWRVGIHTGEEVLAATWCVGRSGFTERGKDPISPPTIFCCVGFWGAAAGHWLLDGQGWRDFLCSFQGSVQMETEELVRRWIWVPTLSKNMEPFWYQVL